MLKLLIVDDSALMRRKLSTLFEATGGFVIEQARTGAEAVALNQSFRPDVVTLDINMPEMDGLTALSLIMADRPVPVIMFSSLTEHGAMATLEALNMGAVDYVGKPGGTISLSIESVQDDLLAKVNAAARARLRKPGRLRAAATAQPVLRRQTKPAAIDRSTSQATGIVLIGVSTGGPRTLEDILPGLSPNLRWPVVVAQHMPGSFTRSFAERLDMLCPLSVVEVAGPMTLEAGTVYIGKGSADVVITTRGGRLAVAPKPEQPDLLWHPSVELLGRSALDRCDAKAIIAVMLTGMGSDGAAAFADIRRKGGRTIAESEDSAIIFGMPKELIDKGGASIVLPASGIARQVNAWVGG